eukprot:12955399-Alexandrium_andersonii.AAC.1
MPGYAVAPDLMPDVAEALTLPQEVIHVLTLTFAPRAHSVIAQPSLGEARLRPNSLSMDAPKDFGVLVLVRLASLFHEVSRHLSIAPKGSLGSFESALPGDGGQLPEGRS